MHTNSLLGVYVVTMHAQSCKTHYLIIIIIIITGVCVYIYIIKSLTIYQELKCDNSSGI